MQSIIINKAQATTNAYRGLSKTSSGYNTVFITGKKNDFSPQDIKLRYDTWFRYQSGLSTLCSIGRKAGVTNLYALHEKVKVTILLSCEKIKGSYNDTVIHAICDLGSLRKQLLYEAHDDLSQKLKSLPPLEASKLVGDQVILISGRRVDSWGKPIALPRTAQNIDNHIFFNLLHKDGECCGVINTSSASLPLLQSPLEFSDMIIANTADGLLDTILNGRANPTQLIDVMPQARTGKINHFTDFMCLSASMLLPGNQFLENAQPRSSYEGRAIDGITTLQVRPKSEHFHSALHGAIHTPTFYTRALEILKATIEHHKAKNVSPITSLVAMPSSSTLLESEKLDLERNSSRFGEYAKEYELAVSQFTNNNELDVIINRDYMPKAVKETYGSLCDDKIKQQEAKTEVDELEFSSKLSDVVIEKQSSAIIRTSTTVPKPVSPTLLSDKPSSRAVLQAGAEIVNDGQTSTNASILDPIETRRLAGIEQNGKTTPLINARKTILQSIVKKYK